MNFSLFYDSEYEKWDPSKQEKRRYNLMKNSDDKIVLDCGIFSSFTSVAKRNPNNEKY